MALIEGGFIIVARRMFEGDLMEKPDLYVKLWLWMLNQANWKDRGKLKRGQFVTTISEMREAMAYLVGYRKKMPSVQQIRSAYEHFANNSMINTAKTTRGMIITIINFDKYQNPKNYEQHTVQHDEKIMNNRVATQDTEEGEEREYKSTLSGTCQQALPDGPPPCPHREIISLYHEILPELPRVRSWNTTNEANLRARWKSVGLDGLRMDSLGAWERLFKYIRSCPFLMGAVDGRGGKPPFQAKLRWIVNQQNFQKIIEGDYYA